MKRLVIALALALAVPAASARATTAPDEQRDVPVTLKRAQIVIPRDKYSTSTTASRFPRGAQVRLAVRNRAGKPAILRLRLTSNLTRIGGVKVRRIQSTGLIAPNDKRHLELNFYYRAKFVFEELVGGKVVARHPLTIF